MICKTKKEKRLDGMLSKKLETAGYNALLAEGNAEVCIVKTALILVAKH